MKGLIVFKKRTYSVIMAALLVSLLLTSCTGRKMEQNTAESVKSKAGVQNMDIAMIEKSNAGNVQPENGFNTEEYSKIQDNEFVAPDKNPLSTFSIDVDTASYSNTRRFIENGQKPPKDAVRIEEMINYFKYDYPQPNNIPFSITSEIAPCPWNTSHNLALIGLQGKNISSESLPPSNLVFLLDVSGSMNDPNKLPLLKSAFKLLVEQLRPQDKISIVTYAGSAGLVLDSTPGSDKNKILGALEKLNAGGSTAGGQGINLAYKVAKDNFIKSGNNRVILATDGDFNVGISSEGELVRLIEEKKDQGIFLTVLGFGTGNYKDSKMEKLADKGNGNYAYIDTLTEAKKVLVNEFGGTLFTIAKDVKLQVEFNPAKIKGYRLVGYENRILNKEDFNNDQKDAGDMGAGHSVTALYELIPVGSNEKVPGVDELKYQKSIMTPNDEYMTVKLRYKEPKEEQSKLLNHVISADSYLKAPSSNFKFAAAVAEFGMLLRDSQFKGNSTFKHVIDTAKASKGTDLDGYRGEFIKLVEKASRMYE